jgi:pimeloyl-ACP methyl ester carboxylesterase
MSWKRHYFDHDGLTFSYLDEGRDAPAIVALHASWMEAGTFAAFAEAMAPEWRVVSLDQRGHGRSGHARDYSRNAFIEDIGALLRHLEIADPVVLVGNSLGGTNAFQYAARYPDRVRALVNEEGPAGGDADLGFIKAWKGVFATRAELERAIGDRLLWSVEPSIREVDQGWTLAFDVDGILEASRHMSGDFWEDWCASSCPALVVRGTQSRVVDGALMERMARVRANSELVSLEGGHVAHHDDPEGFVQAVRQFLRR